MRRTVLTLPLAALALVAWLTPTAMAQDSKSARGTVTAMAANSITVKAGEREMKFTLNEKTVVTAEGGSTATRAAEAAGKSGPKLTELVKVGDAIEVSYREAGGAMTATRIRKVASPGSGGGSTSDEGSETANGTVDTVSASSLTITGSAPGGGGATFKQTFSIDPTTKVIGEGVGTAAAAKGGKASITDLVKTGARVTVTYRKKGTSLVASEVRVR